MGSHRCLPFALSAAALLWLTGLTAAPAAAEPPSDAPSADASSAPESAQDDAAAQQAGESADSESAAPAAPVLTKAPELLQFVEAPYPPEAEAQKIEGNVTLLVSLDETGRVTEALVTEPAGHGFDEAAAEAVRQFVFSPAEIDGAPAAVQLEYVYRFVFRPPPEEETPKELPVSLKGKAIERATRRAVPRALIRCVRMEESADGTHAEADCPEGLPEATSADGTFELRLPPGRYDITLLSDAHEPFRHTEEVTDGEVLEVAYHLTPTAAGQFHTIVKGERERREATRRTVTREEIQTVPGTMGDAVRVIHNLPGVARSAFLGGQMAVRGAAPSETLSYLDGIEIPLLFHFFGGPSVINSEFVEDIDFLPGGFGPRYGRATGGVVDAHTRRGTDEGIHGSFKIDLVDASLFVEAAVGSKTTIAAAARRSYIDAVLSHVTAKSDDYGTVSIVPRYWDYQLRVDHGKASDRDRFTVMLFGSDDKAAASTSGGARELNIDLGGGIGFHRLKASWFRREGIFTNELTPSIGFDRVDFDSQGNAENTGGFDIGAKELRVGLRDEATWKVGGSHLARVGVDFLYDHVWLDGTVPFSAEYRPLPGDSGLTELTEFSRSYDTFSVGLYHVWEIGLFDRLRLYPGLRADLFAMDGKAKWSLDPRLSARFKIVENTTLKASVGHYSQAPAVQYLDRDFGNPDLKMTKAIQTSLGVEQKFPYGISLDVTAFFHFGYDRVASSEEVALSQDGTVTATRYINSAYSRNYGAELLLKKELTNRLSGWMAYTISKSERKTPSDDKYRNSAYDQTHILTLIARYRLPRGWSIGARFRLVSGNPATPVKGSTFNADTGAHEPIYGEYYSDRAPLFHQLDLRADKEWVFKAWKLGIYLDIQNVYWADNTEYIIWDYRYRGNAALSGMPFFPTLGIKGSF